MGFFDFFSDIKESVVDFVDEASGAADERRSKYRRETHYAKKDMRKKATIKAFELWIMNKASKCDGIIVIDNEYKDGIRALHNIYHMINPSKYLQVNKILPFEGDAIKYFEDLNLDDINEEFPYKDGGIFYNQVDDKYPYEEGATFYYTNKDTYIAHLNDKMLSQLAWSKELYEWKAFYNEIIVYFK